MDDAARLDEYVERPLFPTTCIINTLNRWNRCLYSHRKTRTFRGFVRETRRVDEGICDHRRLEIGEVVLVVDTRDIDCPIEGLDILEEGVLERMLDSRRSVATSAVGAVGRSKKPREVGSQSLLTSFT